MKSHLSLAVTIAVKPRKIGSRGRKIISNKMNKKLMTHDMTGWYL